MGRGRDGLTWGGEKEGWVNMGSGGGQKGWVSMRGWVNMGR